MKSVLISIRPKWCELIASGKKTIEVRKSRPKLETPFKVYIYCTKDKHGWFDFGKKERLDGKVIGEFVCDGIADCRDLTFTPSCLTLEQWRKYTGKHKGPVWGWHISNLVIYERPKELGKFYFPPERFCEKGLCGGCPFDESPDVNGEYMSGCEWERPVLRPPQSWCYVEELKDV